MWPSPSLCPVKTVPGPAISGRGRCITKGLMALYSVDKQKAYYNYAVEWGAQHQWNLRDGSKTRNGDNQACGQTYIDLYNIDKKPERIDSIKASIDKMMQGR